MKYRIVYRMQDLFDEKKKHQPERKDIDISGMFKNCRPVKIKGISYFSIDRNQGISNMFKNYTPKQFEVSSDIFVEKHSNNKRRR